MTKRNRQRSRKTEFSKVLLIQESALIWVMTLLFIGLAALCIIRNYIGSLPWLTAMVSLPWTAYGVSQCFYYNKATKENTKGGIKYDTIMADMLNAYGETPPASNHKEETSNTIDIDYGI